MLKKLLRGKPNNFLDECFYSYHPVFRENSFEKKVKILCKEITTDMVENYSFGIDLDSHSYIIDTSFKKIYGIYDQSYIYRIGLPRFFEICAVPEEEDGKMILNAFYSMSNNSIDSQKIYDVMILSSTYISLKFTLNMLETIYGDSLPVVTTAMLHNEINKYQSAFSLKFLNLGIGK